jgi:hypothetical protein
MQHAFIKWPVDYLLQQSCIVDADESCVASPGKPAADIRTFSSRTHLVVAARIEKHIDAKLFNLVKNFLLSHIKWHTWA